ALLYGRRLAGRRYGIVAAAAERIAARQTAHREVAALQAAVPLQRFQRIAGAGRLVAAVMPDPGRQEQPVGLDGESSEAGERRHAAPDAASGVSPCHSFS